MHTYIYDIPAWRHVNNETHLIDIYYFLIFCSLLYKVLKMIVSCLIKKINSIYLY